ncbi:hypothetical protein NEMIN01_0194 [Nematocida minor]|uniref:uncharacterized protein n=1 Tax=Nematocida minor TaxID=1912983 RepID=UPI00221E7DBF|nr:uncharacterized protein NEMIN01_0090 [Nematocida minor]XP_051332096.1 uncharacterized protein NEMIN01_0194 [Nematocida minor]KAI5188826.1 hypothetical protein NEMIN01_0090 [Nematocida minor]KAI5188930.1 hypothetical protein NEMIN01_0194 [Nematocida minor]
MKIQYVIVRNDTGFSKGSTAAQAVHAAVLCYHEHFDEDFSLYVLLGSKMTTVVLQCTKEELARISSILDEKKIKHSKWLEMPENEVTSLAIYPYEKELVQSIREIRSLRLY